MKSHNAQIKVVDQKLTGSGWSPEKLAIAAKSRGSLQFLRKPELDGGFLLWLPYVPNRNKS